MTTEEDRAVLNRDSIRRIASVLGILTPDANSDELRQAIGRTDRETSEILNNFLDAWNGWYEFHRQISENEQAGRLTAEQRAELTGLIRIRNQTRTALIRKVKKLELRRITVKVPQQSSGGNELEIATKVRRDLYSHGPIEIDPDSPEFSINRDTDGSVSFAFITAHESMVKDIIERFGYRDKVSVQIDQTDGAESCLNCGTVYSPIMPAVCDNCGFRDISPCPRCREDVPRGEYLKISGNLFRCPACAARVRLRFNDLLSDQEGRYVQPIVIVEDAIE
jgi:hypothetical protein